MTKQFSLLQLSSILDNRLSTTIEDVFDMLNHICGTKLMIHQLPIAFNYLKSKNPYWYCDLKTKLETIIDTSCPVKERNYEQFLWMMDYLEKNNSTHEIPQLKDEFDTSDFGEYMVNNSLLLNR